MFVDYCSRGLVLLPSGESRMPQMIPMTRLAQGNSSPLSGILAFPDPVRFGKKRGRAIRGEGLPWDPPAWRGAREHTLPPASPVPAESPPQRTSADRLAAPRKVAT